MFLFFSRELTSSLASAAVPPTSTTKPQIIKSDPSSPSPSPPLGPASSLLYPTLGNHHNSSNIAQPSSASVFPVSHHPVGNLIAELEELQQDLSAAAVIPTCYQQQAGASRAGGQLSSLPGQPRAAVHQRAAYSVAAGNGIFHQASSQPAPSFPQQTAAFPQQTAAFSQQTAGFPQQTAGFPQQTTSFSQQTTNFPQQTTSFPQQTTGFPQQTTGFSQQTTNFPQQTTGLSLQTTSYPQQTSSIIQQTTSLPFDTSSYSQFSSNANYPSSISNHQYGTTANGILPLGQGSSSSSSTTQYQGFSSLYNELESAMQAEPSPAATPPEEVTIVDDDDDDDIAEIEFVRATTTTVQPSSAGSRAGDAAAIVIPSGTSWPQPPASWQPPTADASIVAATSSPQRGSSVPQRRPAVRGNRGRGRATVQRGSFQPQVPVSRVLIGGYCYPWADQITKYQ